MLTTRRPLEEKLALFWHGHFATGDAKVRDYRMMLRQNEMLRAHAESSLRDLLVGILKVRTVYTTMIKEWLGYDDTEAVLKGRFEPLRVFA